MPLGSRMGLGVVQALSPLWMQGSGSAEVARDGALEPGADGGPASVRGEKWEEEEAAGLDTREE